MARTKPRRADRRKRRDRASLAQAAGLAAALLLLASGVLWLTGAGAPRTAGIGGPFNLVGGDGQAVTERSFPGQVLLIYFGYTACRDVCPTTLSSVAAALDGLGGRAGQVQPLFITVDPERDTPPVMRAYAASFTPRLVGLTGTLDQIRKVADEYRVAGVAHHAGTDPAEYEVDHSAVLYLVGPDGRYIAPIRADESAAGMAQIIAGHLSS